MAPDKLWRRLWLVVAGAAVLLTVSAEGALAVSGDDTISTFAGGGRLGARDGIAARSATIVPRTVAVDSQGNVYFTHGGAVRKISRNGIVTTIAGETNRYGSTGDGGPAALALLRSPQGLAVDADGNVYFADQGDGRVRKVSRSGTITTVMGGGPNSPPESENVLNAPYGVALDRAGNLYVTDQEHNRVRRRTPGGTITTVAGNGVSGTTGDGGPATQAAISHPTGIAVDPQGYVYISTASRVRRFMPGGTITTVAGTDRPGTAGDGGPATSAQLNFPLGLALDRQGSLYIGEYSSYRVRKVNGGTITTVAGTGTGGYSGDGGAASEASLRSVSGVAIDGSGSLLIADGLNGRIRRVAAGSSPTGGGTVAKLRAGRWSGSVKQSNLGTRRFTLTLQLLSPPLETLGRVQIPADRCVGTVRPLRTSSRGAYVFEMTWQQGVCADGTMTLRPLSGNRLSYHWEDGRGVFSDAILLPAGARSAPAPGSGAGSGAATRQLRTFADRIERILIQSAAGRRALASALTAGFNCSITTRAAGDAVNRVVANRQSLLRQLAALRAPTPQAANALALLRQGLRHSVEADIRYRDGFYALGASGCPLPPNRNFTLARESDTKASTAKRRFVAAYNPLAKRVGRRTWSANQI